MGRGELRSLAILFVIDFILSGTLGKVGRLINMGTNIYAEDCGALDV